MGEKHTPESVAEKVARALLKAPAVNREHHRKTLAKKAGKKKATRAIKP